MVAAAPYTKDPSQAKLEDFIPHWDPKYQRERELTQTPEDIMSALRSMSGKKYPDAKGDDDDRSRNRTVHP
jgi:hypothetical protein